MLQGQRYKGIFLLMAAAMHLTMVLLCGQLGGFSQAGWTGLLAVSHSNLEDQRCSFDLFDLVT